jgi:5-aminolevulinate synthase
VDVWRTLKLPFTSARIVPLRREEPVADRCTYPEMKRAAE